MKRQMMWLLAVLLVAGIGFSQSAYAQEKKKKETNEERAQRRAQLRMDNLNQTIHFDDASKQKAVEYTYAYLLGLDELNPKRNPDLKMTEEEIAAAKKANSDTYSQSMRALMTKEQREAYKAWQKLSTEEREKPVGQ